jgi:hypothetical protein
MVFFKKKEQEPITIESLVFKQDTLDKYILDEENAIIVVQNENKNIDGNNYEMIHERLVDEALVKVNSWGLRIYRFVTDHDESLIKDLNLFKIQNDDGYFDALYDYKNDKFIISKGVWNQIGFEYLDKYNGILGFLEIKSDFSYDDTYSYINCVTGEKVYKSFNVSDGIYYAMLNLDGTIRGNKLFKGNDFSEIEQIIDLNEYESLLDFKNKRKEICNQEKMKRKQEYSELIKSKKCNSTSPYLDNEVLKILKLKK